MKIQIIQPRAIAIAGLLSLVAFSSVCSGQSQSGNAPTASTAVVTAKDEPGEALIVTGVVYGEDGRTPIRGATVYVFHTDARGYYRTDSPAAGERDPRLKATMITDSNGRFEFRTIKPGSYPDSRIPAHIHFKVNASGYSERVFEIVFEGDPFIDDRIREKSKDPFSNFSIRSLTKNSDGILHCAAEVRLRK